MSPKWVRLLTVVTAVIGINAGRSEAGFFCCSKHSKCEPCACSADPCCRPKRHCCCPPDAPRGPVSFAVPAVVTAGQAVPVSNEVVLRGLRTEAARDFRRSETATRALNGEPALSDEDRLDKLEKDVAKLTDLTSRLTVVVEKLDRTINAK